MIKNNLFPPIIDTYAPSFVRTSNCRVYFSLSDFNTKTDIKNVQVMVNNQNTNKTMLSYNSYPTGIMITTLKEDSTKQGNDKYYIEIKPSDLNNEIFNLNQYYKVQLRFTGVAAEDLTDMKKIAAWLVNNQNFFSEWSTVCLVRGIGQPKFYFRNFNNDIQANVDSYIYTPNLSIAGSMYFDGNDAEEKEILNSYRFQLFKRDSTKVLADSGIIYSNSQNSNEIFYNFKYLLEQSTQYTIKFSYVTNNLYSNYINIKITTSSFYQSSLNANIKAEADDDNGLINIFIHFNEAFSGTLSIKRSCFNTNYTVWEDIHIIQLKSTIVGYDYNWSDMTAESGVWYKYGIQLKNEEGTNSSFIKMDKPILVFLDDLFLTNNRIQLKIKFDPQISSFKYKVSESIIETIGSKYPFIKRNGDLGYKQFSLSGLISFQMDDNGLFARKRHIKDNSLQYKLDNRIYDYNNYIFEKNFRDSVIDFLCDKNIKLLRSTTEGNILIKLTDVNLTPNQTLGRKVYSFSATATEIDESTIDNYDIYNIQKINNQAPSDYILESIEYNNREDIVTLTDWNLNLSIGSLIFTRKEDYNYE